MDKCKGDMKKPNKDKPILRLNHGGMVGDSCGHAPMKPKDTHGHKPMNGG